MKNPASSRDCIYLVRIEDVVRVIPVTFSRTGAATAWYGFSDKSIGKASGYGYDKESSALAAAIDFMVSEYAMEVKGKVPQSLIDCIREIKTAGATGVTNVMNVANRHGVRIVETYQFSLSKF